MIISVFVNFTLGMQLPGGAARMPEAASKIIRFLMFGTNEYVKILSNESELEWI